MNNLTFFHSTVQVLLSSFYESRIHTFPTTEHWYQYWYETTLTCSNTVLVACDYTIYMISVFFFPLTYYVFNILASPERYLSSYWEMTHHYFFQTFFHFCLRPTPWPLFSTSPPIFPTFPLLSVSSRPSPSFSQFLVSAGLCPLSLHLSFSPIFPSSFTNESIPPLLASVPPVFYPPCTPFHLLLFPLPPHLLNLCNSGTSPLHSRVY